MKENLAKPTNGDSDVALLWGLGGATTVAGCIGLLLVFLMQPDKYPNPGLAAYEPPPGTRLLPISHKSDAPELADFPVEEPPALNALANARKIDVEAKRAPERPVRKRTRSASRPRLQREAGDARSHWNGWRNDGNGNFWNSGSSEWF